MERLLGFDAQLLFDSAVTAVNIFILFFALSYFLFNPVKNFLDKRRDKIAGELDSAAALQKKAQALKEEYEGKLRKAGWESERILEEADKRGKQYQAELVREAKEECARLRERTEKELELQRLRALDEMKKEAVGLAAQMSVQIMAGLVDAKAQELLMERTLKEIGDVRWRS